MTQAANKMKEVYQTQLTDVKTTDDEGVGTLRQEGDKWYRWVKNVGASALAAGRPVCYDASLNETMHEAVIMPHDANIAAADIPFLAGVAISAVAASSYGWILVHGWYEEGFVGIASSNSEITVGNECVVVNGTDASNACLIGSVVRSAAKDLTQLGRIVAMESAASGTAALAASTVSGSVWIRCLNV